jgi:hypothetical protein
VYAALKFGFVALGLGLLCYLVLYAVYGGMGPCALPGQLEILLLGLALTGVGGLVCLVSIPMVGPSQEIQSKDSKFCPLTFRSNTSPPLTTLLESCFTRPVEPVVLIRIARDAYRGSTLTQ